MNLPNDITRCANDTCPLRFECERWVQLTRDEEAVWVTYCQPRQEWTELSIPIWVCDYQIKPSSQVSEGE